MSEDSEQKKSSILENHFQTILLAVNVGVLGWMGLTVQDSTVRIATLTEKVSNLESRLSNTDLYTTSDAEKDNRLLDEKLAVMMARITALEGRR